MKMQSSSHVAAPQGNEADAPAYRIKQYATATVIRDSSNREAVKVVPPKLSFGQVMSKATSSGTAGALAMGGNILGLMWIRTILNYQYRNGGSYVSVFRKLHAEGGLRRFYRGLPLALMQGPLCRFGDTAANTGAMVLLNSNPETASWNVGAKTFVASSFASLFRVVIMPIESCRIMMQVTGSVQPMFVKVRTNGVPVLFHGSVAAMSASVVGHFPWFFTYNFLSEKLPKPESTLGELGRRATIGFCASVASDTLANSLWAMKVYKQTHERAMSYPEVVKSIVSESGVSGLFCRGLETRILANGMQGMMFTVLWKYFESEINRRQECAK